MFIAWICGFILGAAVIAAAYYWYNKDAIYIVNQSGNIAGGDIVGRDKVTKQYPFGGQ